VRPLRRFPETVIYETRVIKTERNKEGMSLHAALTTVVEGFTPSGKTGLKLSQIVVATGVDFSFPLESSRNGIEMIKTKLNNNFLAFKVHTRQATTMQRLPTGQSTPNQLSSKSSGMSTSHSESMMP